MESLGNPQTWVPYENVKDCSQGFCSLYCPQWCYIVLPPPPPYRFPDEASNTNFSTLFIVIISVLASVFLIGSYYAIISKFCGIFNWWRGGRRRNEYSNSIGERNESHSPNQQPSQVTVTGLDDASIKSIKSFKYNKGNGLIEGTDCPVCLGEFQEDESLRLLPKCSHAFHLSCIDTWLKSQSNCPLCRASVVCTSNQESLPNLTSSQENQVESHAIVSLRDLDQRAGDEIVASNDIIPKNSSQDLWPQLEGLEQSDVVIEIGVKGGQAIRRSVSMDLSSCSSHVSIGDILKMNQDAEEYKREERWQRVGLGSSSKQRAGDHSTLSKNRRKVSDFVTSLGEMKRSFSSGRFVVF